LGFDELGLGEFWWIGSPLLDVLFQPRDGFRRAAIGVSFDRDMGNDYGAAVVATPVVVSRENGGSYRHSITVVYRALNFCVSAMYARLRRLESHNSLAEARYAADLADLKRIMDSSHWTITIRIPKPKRSWLQVQLRTLFLVTLGVALLLGSFHWNRPVTPESALFGKAKLSQQELALMVGAFVKAGLNDWELREQRLLVPVGDRPLYLAALVDDNCFPETN